MNAGNKKKKAEKEAEKDKQHRGWGWTKPAASPDAPTTHTPAAEPKA
jgi:hypothetical protein